MNTGYSQFHVLRAFQDVIGSLPFLQPSVPAPQKNVDSTVVPYSKMDLEVGLNIAKAYAAMMRARQPRESSAELQVAIAF